MQSFWPSLLFGFITAVHCVFNDQAAFAQYSEILESSNRRAVEIEKMTKEAAVIENQRNAALARSGLGGNSSLAAGMGQFLPEHVGPPFGQLLPATVTQLGLDGNSMDTFPKGKTGPSRADDEEFLSKMQAQSQIVEHSMQQPQFPSMRPMFPPFGSGWDSKLQYNIIRFFSEIMPNHMLPSSPMDQLAPHIGVMNMFGPQQFSAQRIPLRAPSRLFSIEDERTTRIAPRPGTIEEPVEERAKLPSRE